MSSEESLGCPRTHDLRLGKGFIRAGPAGLVSPYGKWPALGVFGMRRELICSILLSEGLRIDSGSDGTSRLKGILSFRPYSYSWEE